MGMPVKTTGVCGKCNMAHPLEINGIVDLPCERFRMGYESGGKTVMEFDLPTPDKAFADRLDVYLQMNRRLQNENK